VGAERGEEGNLVVVVDTHRYYTFSERDRCQSLQEIIARFGSELGGLDGIEGSVIDRGVAQVITGEWGCMLGENTWGRVKPEGREGLVREFGLAQSRKCQQRAGGSYFWTYKMGGGWDFVKQTKKRNVVPPPFLELSAHGVRSRTQAAQVRRQGLASSARRAHEEYWNRTCLGKTFEHDLYIEGREVGFYDALKFFRMRADDSLAEKVAGEGGDKIGCLEIWVKKRLVEFGKRFER
jgi:hypothetical protein